MSLTPARVAAATPDAGAPLSLIASADAPTGSQAPATQEPASAYPTMNPKPSPKIEGIPAHIAELRAEENRRDTAQFDYRDAVKEISDPGVRHEGAEMMADLAINQFEAGDFIREIDAGISNPEPAHVWIKQSEDRLKELSRQHNNRPVESLLADAAELIHRDPRIVRFLDESGLGNNPKIVERFVELGFRARMAGRLPSQRVKK